MGSWDSFLIEDYIYSLAGNERTFCFPAANMSIHEKSSDSNGSDDDSALTRDVYQRPTGLKGIYYNPHTQVKKILQFESSVAIGIHRSQFSASSASCVQVCRVSISSLSYHPGLFNALNGLGGGGQLDSATNSNANSALYATFAAMAFFAGYTSPFTVPVAQTAVIDQSTTNWAQN